MIIVAMLLCGCSKNDTTGIDTNAGGLFIIGHGGTGDGGLQTEPINTFEAHRRAMEVYGADGVETDIQLSADGVLFMYHDFSLENATGCAGCIATNTASDIKNCAFKIDNDQQVGTVEDLLAYSAGFAVKPKVFLDLHVRDICGVEQGASGNYRKAMVDAVKLLADKYDAYDWLYLQCPDAELLKYALSIMPSLRVLLDGDIGQSEINSAVTYGFYGVAAHTGNITSDEVAQAHDAGLKVQIHRLLTQADISEALDMKPDYIMTDNLPLAVSMVR